MEAIVFQTETFNGEQFIAGPLVIGQDHDPTTRAPRVGIWIGYGDRTWYLRKNHVVKLRDFCSAILATNVSEQEPNVVDITGPEPAFDPNAVNPGGEAAEQWGG